MPTVYKGRVFSVEVDTVRLPDGRDRHVEIVRHAPCVVIIPMQDDDHVVLVRQYRHPITRETWELPAGSLDDEELAEAAALRECEEETGLRPGRLERIRGLFSAPGYCDEEMIFFRATALAPPPADSPHRPDEDEDIRVQAFTIAEARAMLERGEIVDLKSAYGLTLIR
jgi:ADP-ribose pyrophosphatase